MATPALQELPSDLQKVLDPSKPKLLELLAKGVAPLPPSVLVTSWCYMAQGEAAELAEQSRKSLQAYPKNILAPLLQGDLPAWALRYLAEVFIQDDQVLEPILLNDGTPTDVFMDVAKTCTEKIAVLISSNQERIIEVPDIIVSLESNPRNLKSNTDRLRHFLKLAGVFVSGGEVIEDAAVPVEETAGQDDLPKEGDDIAEAHSQKMEKMALAGSKLNDEDKHNLTKFIAGLNIGGKIKLAMKGGKEARSTLIKDSNKVVSLAVLKSPRITEPEVSFYASLKSLDAEVIRVISTTAGWTKTYNVKISLCLNPKTPLQASSGFIKFLNMRDLQKVTRDRNIPNPLRKASKELFNLKRK